MPKVGTYADFFDKFDFWMGLIFGYFMDGLGTDYPSQLSIHE